MDSLTGDNFSDAKSKKEEAFAAAKKLNLKNSHERYEELRGSDQGTLRQRREEIKILSNKEEGTLSEDEKKRLELLQKEEAEYKGLI
jgi:hypothetical protein